MVEMKNKHIIFGLICICFVLYFIITNLKCKTIIKGDILVKIQSGIIEKKEDIESRANELRDKIEESQKILQSVFNRYYPNSNYQDSFVSEIRDYWYYYKNLSNRQNSLHNTRTGLTNEVDNIEKELREAFTKFYNIIDNKELSATLSKLKADVQEFETLNQKYNKTKSSREEAERQRLELINSIEFILKKYNTYFENKPYNDSIESLRNLFLEYQKASKNVMDFWNRKKELEECP